MFLVLPLLSWFLIETCHCVLQPVYNSDSPFVYNFKHIFLVYTSLGRLLLDRYLTVLLTFILLSLFFTIYHSFALLYVLLSHEHVGVLLPLSTHSAHVFETLAISLWEHCTPSLDVVLAKILEPSSLCLQNYLTWPPYDKEIET